MKFNCKILDQRIVDDLIAVEVSGANGFLQKQFGQFLNFSTKHLLEIQTALRISDYKSAREAVHKLGGLSGTFGALTVSLACRAIESNIAQNKTLSLESDITNLRRHFDEAKAEVEILLSDIPRDSETPRSSSVG